jgi:uncharacterized protein (TIGR00255 family)
MTLKSMTGYGSGEASGGGLKVQVELSSVNRKQLDVHINLPRSIAALESRIFEVIHGGISRGHITGSVTVSVSEGSRRKGVKVDRVLAAAFVREIRETASALGLPHDLTSRSLLQMPDVVQYEYVESDIERVWPILLKALKQALNRMVQMRISEGQALAEDLSARFLKLSSVYLAQIRKAAPDVTGRYRKQLQTRLKKAGFSITQADQQLLKELALFAEKCDISEEMTRLDSHLKQAVQLLHSKEAVGRTLDFLCQEMFRETNTIGSKANDAVIARWVILFKTELERVREQVQNVE